MKHAGLNHLRDAFQALVLALRISVDSNSEVDFVGVLICVCPGLQGEHGIRHPRRNMLEDHDVVDLITRCIFDHEINVLTVLKSSGKIWRSSRSSMIRRGGALTDGEQHKSLL